MPKKTLPNSRVLENIESIRPRKGMRKKTLYVIILLIVLALAAYFAYNYYWTVKRLSELTDPAKQTEAANKEMNELTKKVGKLIVLPSGETPTFATITDINALTKEQPFYQGASNGDKILVYKNAKMGIVYDPKRDIIVKVGPVYFQDDSTPTTPDTTTAKDTTTSKNDSSSTTSGLTKSTTSNSSSSSTGSNTYNTYNSKP